MTDSERLKSIVKGFNNTLFKLGRGSGKNQLFEDMQWLFEQAEKSIQDNNYSEETKYQIADIVRFKPEEEKFGLYEVTGYSANGEITLTNNECNSEFYADENNLILVCPAKDRKDIIV